MTHGEDVWDMVYRVGKGMHRVEYRIPIPTLYPIGYAVGIGMA